MVMETTKNTELLAGLAIKAAIAAIVITVCWYFRSTIIYIAVAAVVSFICRPVARTLGKVRIKTLRLPSWLTAVVSICLVLTVIIGIITQIIPVVNGIVQNVTLNLKSSALDGSAVAEWFERANLWLIDRIPRLGRGFKLQESMTEWVTDAFDVSSITSVVGSVATILGNIGIGLFSVVFICFFFVKDENLFRKIIGAIVPDEIEDEAIIAVGEIEHLLTRYFGGLVCEIIGVALIDFIGLWAIARIGLYPAIGIAFIAGLLNIIPYVGPWIGCALGTALGVVIKFSAATAAGTSPALWMTAVTILAVFIFTQVVDNFLFQPLIYSKSIKSSPLEIFIVLLMAGHIGGVAGMLVAIPSYTVIRVVASRFLRGFKPVRRLMEATEDQSLRNSR